MRLGFHGNPIDDRRIGVEHIYAAMHDAPPTAALHAIRGRGRIPLLTVEPWHWPDHGGTYDQAAWRYALEQVGPMYARFAHEPNLSPADAEKNGYSWAAGDPDEYRALWSKWARSLPPNVATVWGVNVDYPGACPLGDYFPVGGLVDFVGVDGYNWSSKHASASFRKIFGGTLEMLPALTGSMPLMVCETGCAQAAKAQWLRGMWDTLVKSRLPLEAVCYFNVDKERSWSLKLDGDLEAFLRGKK